MQDAVGETGAPNFLIDSDAHDVPGGLQVHHGGEWIDVPALRDTFVVNCGDYLSLLTGGRFVSPLHRVVTGLQERCVVLASEVPSKFSFLFRFSFVLFYYPDYDAQIPSIRGACSRLAWSKAREPVLRCAAGKQGYSLLANQQLDGGRSRDVDTTPTDSESLAKAEQKIGGSRPFGDYITEKWAQVYRKPGSY